MCGGVCAAVAITVRTRAPAESAATRRAAAINLLLGDYVEACYPYMDKSRAVNAAAYLGAALAGAALLVGGDAPPRASAYLPVPLAVAVAEEPAAVATAAALAFVVPFVGVLFVGSAPPS